MMKSGHPQTQWPESKWGRNGSIVEGNQGRRVALLHNKGALPVSLAPPTANFTYA